MEEITVGQILGTIGTIAGAISAIGVIIATMKKLNDNLLKANLKPILDKMTEIEAKVDDVDRNVCKNYVTEYLGEEKRGVEHTETETRLFWENYDRYTAKGGNSWVHETIETLKREGKL